MTLHRVGARVQDKPVVFFPARQSAVAERKESRLSTLDQFVSDEVDIGAARRMVVVRRQRQEAAGFHAATRSIVGLRLRMFVQRFNSLACALLKNVRVCRMSATSRRKAGHTAHSTPNATTAAAIPTPNCMD